jgi:hypothetical protein
VVDQSLLVRNKRLAQLCLGGIELPTASGELREIQGAVPVLFKGRDQVDS